MKRLNVTACREALIAGNYSNYTNYAYHGPVRGILNGTNTSFVTLQGCRELCGEGTDYYPWPEVSSTITTWVRFLLYLAKSAAHAGYYVRFCQSSGLLYRHPLKAMRTSKASWRLPAGTTHCSIPSLCIVTFFEG